MKTKIENFVLFIFRVFVVKIHALMGITFHFCDNYTINGLIIRINKPWIAGSLYAADGLRPVIANIF